MLDTLNAHLRSVLGVTRTQSTGLQAAYFGVGYFLFSPVAGWVLKRRGYKVTIIMGLVLYSTGAILFWPVARESMKPDANKQGIFGGFVVLTALTACGLASLEVSANSYITVMPPQGVSALRLQLSQGFNGIGSFAGPLIASKYFFSDGHDDDLNNVQWVYLAVSAVGFILAFVFLIYPLPEVHEDELVFDTNEPRKPLWKETRALSAAVAQFMYVGAQVMLASFFIFLAEDAGINHARGSELLSYSLIMFTIGRFLSVALMVIWPGAVVLFGYTLLSLLFTILTASLSGMTGVAMLMIVMFFESCIYPCIFAMGTAGLGQNTRRGGSLIVMGVVGGAVFPPAQMAIADRWNTRVSYFLVVPCFVYIAGWAVYIWHIDGRKMINLGKDDDSSSVSSASTAVETGLDGLETPVNEKETIKIEV